MQNTSFSDTVHISGIQNRSGCAHCMFALPPNLQTVYIIYFLVMQTARSFRTTSLWRPTARFLSSFKVDATAEVAPTVKPTWVMRFDGGSRGNPGLGGAGAVIYNCLASGDLNETWRGYFYIGPEGITNNQAEYAGLLLGLAQCKKMSIQSVCIQGDSEVVLRQMQGTYRVRHIKLIPMHRKALRLLSDIPVITYQHIPRAQNCRADELSNMAMDRKSSMQAFSPEFAALLEDHSESNNGISAVDTAGLAPIRKKVSSKAKSEPAETTEVPVKKRRGRPPASETTGIRSMEQTVDVRTLPDPLPIIGVSPAVEVVVVVKKPGQRKARAVAVVVGDVHPAPDLGASLTVEPSAVQAVLTPIVLPSTPGPVEPVVEVVKKRTKTRKPKEVVDDAVVVGEVGEMHSVADLNASLKVEPLAVQTVPKTPIVLPSTPGPVEPVVEVVKKRTKTRKPKVVVEGAVVSN